MSLQERFDKAANDVKVLKSSPENNDLLILYSLFKQATVGDCNTESPGMFDFKGKYKWQAWNDIKGMSKENAMEAYIKKVEELIASIGLA